MGRTLILVGALLLCFAFWVGVVAKLIVALGGSLGAIATTLLAIVLTFLLGFVAGIPK